jgi:hypothetical protein
LKASKIDRLLSGWKNGRRKIDWGCLGMISSWDVAQEMEPTCGAHNRRAAGSERLTRTRKLFAFLRLHRHEIFDDRFQDELAAMYRDTGAGDTPRPPALMCLALLLQRYVQASDAEAPELSVMDARWQLVLGCLGAKKPAFSQGGLQQFRERLIAHDMDRRLLERTVEVAKRSRGFDWKKLPKELRVGMDSRPLEGAGRVEDTYNLLGHAARKLLDGAAKLTGQTQVSPFSG